MELPSHTNEVPEQKSFYDNRIPWVALQTRKDPYSVDRDYLLCAFSKHHQHTLVIPSSRTIFLRNSEVCPPLQMICLRQDVFAERDANLELNLFVLARKLLPAYHDGAPQYCPVCENSALVRLFLSFFLPPFLCTRNLTMVYGTLKLQAEKW